MKKVGEAMSDISNNIRLNDYMSSTLQTINNTMQRTILIMHQLNSRLQTLGAGGSNGLNGLNAELSAVMAQAHMLASVIASIGTGAGPSGAVFQQLLNQLTAAQSRITALENQLATLGNGSHLPQIQHLTSDLEEARRRIQQLEHDLEELRGNNDGKKLFSLESLSGGIGKVQDAFSKLGQVTQMADEFANANIRLNTMNDGLRTQAELQQQVLDIANRTGTSYTATADFVSKMGRTKQFQGDNDSAIRFTDIANKSLNISGASTEDASEVITQLTEAMSSGTLSGEQFNTILQKGGRIAGALSTELGVSVEGLSKMAEAGTLTADVVVNAMMKQGAAIDEEFAKMPRTFGQNVEVMKNIIGSWLADLAMSGGALGKLNQLFTDFLNWLMQNNGIFDGLSAGLYAVVYLIELLANGFGYLMQVVDTLGPVFDAVLYGVIVAGLLFATQAAWGLVSGLLASLPALAATVAGWMLMHLPIVLIGAAIGILIATLTHFGFTANDILTFVGGLFGGLAAGIANNFIFLTNVIDIFKNFLKNVFKDPVYAVKSLFYNLVDEVLKYINEMVKGLIGGVNWVITQVNSKLNLGIKTFEYHEIKNPLEKPTSDKDIEEYEGEKYTELIKGAGKGADFFNSFLSDKKEQNLPGGSNIPGMSTMPQSPDIGNVNNVNKVGKIDDDVNIADEDLKMLMELAVQNRVNQINLSVQTSAPNVTQNNIVNNEMDVQAVTNQLATGIYNSKQVMVEQDY